MEFDLKEIENLNKTLEVLREKIKKSEGICEDGLKENYELGKYHWENRAEMDEIERATSRYNIERSAIITNDNLAVLRKLREALKSPYFGKITFLIDDEDQSDNYYIGITSITNGDDVDVIDWRCPIATLFYNSKIGKTYYKAPKGIINCNLEQRKQIKIKDSKLERIIDSDVHIDDEMLQDVLSKSSTDKMKNIVSTIQEEQNDIIRNLKDRTIIVQGCAGSGKTSVGLHRLAYLLYNDQKSKSENMLIFSPSDVFSSYIANVLPELGENNAMQSTFKDFSEAFVKGFDKLESYVEFVSKYYNGLNTDEKNKLNAFKFSNDFKEALDEFVLRKSDEYRFTDDFSISNETIIKEYLNALLESDSLKNLPVYEKAELLSDDIYRMLPKKEINYKNTIKNKIIKELVKKYNPKNMYNEFLSSEEFVSRFGAKDKIKNKALLEYPDLIGMLYLHFEMMGYPENDIIHHVVIDEAQDYTPLQMKMIQNMFKGSTFTVLGDADQTINPYHKYDSLEDMKKVLGQTAKYMELNKAYRSSPEIMNYTGALLGKEVTSVRKSENNEVKIKDVDKKDLFKELVTDVMELKEKGYERVCIITRSKNEAKAIYDGLKSEVDNLVVIEDDMKDINTNTFVSPAYMAKGLEFDAVISYNDKENSYTEDDKYLYYVACTRAQHNLVVYNEPQKIKKLGGK